VPNSGLFGPAAFRKGARQTGPPGGFAMELISRVTVQRHEMGDTGQAQARVLAIFRVLGQSPERARKLLVAEMIKASGPIIVLGLGGQTLSPAQKEICLTAVEQGIRLSSGVVVCGADPGQIFGSRGVDGKALQWYPSIPSLLSSYEMDGIRQISHAAR